MNRRIFRFKPRTHGWTVLEICAAIAIVLTLAALAAVAWRKLPGIADRARCLSNMRSLHTSFETYLQDKGRWPQVPTFNGKQNRQWSEWWIAEMQPYGATEAVWMCNGAKKLSNAQDEQNRLRISYSPTQFDANPITPHRWARQPWLVEIGNIHGEGPFISFPDGSIKSLNEVLGK